MCAISGENGLANHLKTWKTKKDRKGKLKESLLCKNLFFEVSQKKKNCTDSFSTILAKYWTGNTTIWLIDILFLGLWTNLVL